MTLAHRAAQTERIVRGEAIRLPLVQWLAAVESRRASRITWHAHALVELLLLLEGRTAYEFAGGRSVELSGGHFLIVPRGARHRGMYDVRRPVRLFGIVFDPRRAGATANTAFTRGDLRWIAEQCETHALTPHAMNAELRRLVASLAHQARTYRGDDALAAAKLRVTACATLLEAVRQTHVARDAKHDQAVRAAVACIEANYAHALPMETVARAARVSRSRLFPLFKQVTGMTPNDYVQRLRVTAAAERLHATDQTITEIALACGFNTSQYFSCVFAKHMSMTPTAFRALKRHAALSRPAAAAAAAPIGAKSRLKTAGAQPAITLPRPGAS